MSFNFELDISNLGKIKNAKINVKPLTIIAGENSSGKTFITKSLYTILNTLSIPHFANTLQEKYTQCELSFERLMIYIQSPATIDFDFQNNMVDYFDDIQDMINILSKKNILDELTLLENYQKVMISIEEVLDLYISERLKYKKFQKIEHYFYNFQDSFKKMKSLFDDPIAVMGDSISDGLSEGLKKNFQIVNTGSLIKSEQNKNAKINISTLGEVELEKKSPIKFSFSSSGIREVQKLSNVVFFDSPIYMKIRKALESINENRQFRMRRIKDDDKYLKGYPEYIEELYLYTKQEFIGIPEFEEISQEIQTAIAGKLMVTSSGEVIYKDTDGNEIPLSLTAMGIGNIGTIDLLIRNNIIDQGSFLIMDEPEVHLHPKWQVKLAQVLYKLAQNGANIVIATHSLDFLKAFQVMFEDEQEKAEEIIAINKMPYDQEFSLQSEHDKIDIVLDDLSEPFYNLYTRA